MIKGKGRRLSIRTIKILVIVVTANNETKTRSNERQI